MNNGIHTDEHFMPQSFKLMDIKQECLVKWHLGHSQENPSSKSEALITFMVTTYGGWLLFSIFQSRGH